MKSKNIIESIKSGAIGVMPTDTIYGLVGSAFNKNAVKRIYSVRKRNPKKPLIILISSIDDLKKFSVVLPTLRRFNLRKIWPGKISIIFPLRRLNLRKLEYLHRGTGKLAFRMPTKKSLLGILEKTGPIVAPSANVEGKITSKNISEAKKYFGDKIDFYTGKGNLDSEPSTIIQWENNEFILVREGSVSVARLKQKKLLK